MKSHTPNPVTSTVTPTVRFSLAEMLAELEREQASGAFTMEKLNQAEIIKLFETRRHLRVKKT